MLRGLSPDETRKNLDAILTKFKAEGVPVLLLGSLLVNFLIGNELSKGRSARSDVPRRTLLTIGIVGNQAPVLARPSSTIQLRTRRMRRSMAAIVASHVMQTHSHSEVGSIFRGQVH